MAEELEGQIGGRYEIVRTLGKGGMGVVYLVNDIHVDRQRALKTLLPKHGLDDDMHERFEIEREALKAINHDCVVEILDLGFDQQRALPFLVMELLKGEDLKQVLKRRKTLAPATALKVLEQVAQALDAMHANDVVHRDLKPSNVFIQQRVGGLAQVKVLDFGIAKLLTSDGEASTIAGGTPGFVAPEQLVGKGIGPHTDIYTFGKLARTLLYGYRSDGANESAAFVRWLCVATAHEPQRRFKTAALAYTELASALGVPRGSSSRHLEWAELEGSAPVAPEVVAPPLVVAESIIADAPTLEAPTELAATLLLPRRRVERRRRTALLGGVSAACALLLLAGYSLREPRVETQAVWAVPAVAEREVVDSALADTADAPAPVATIIAPVGTTIATTAETVTTKDDVKTEELPAEARGAGAKKPPPKKPPPKKRIKPTRDPLEIY